MSRSRNKARKEANFFPVPFVLPSPQQIEVPTPTRRQSTFLCCQSNVNLMTYALPLYTLRYNVARYLGISDLVKLTHKINYTSENFWSLGICGPRPRQLVSKQ